MAKATMFKIERCPLVDRESQVSSSRTCHFELLTFALQRFGPFTGGTQRLVELAPLAKSSADFTDQSAQAGVCIEQIALGIAAQKRLVRMLTVDIDQPFTHFAQLLRRCRRTIDVGRERPPASTTRRSSNSSSPSRSLALSQ